MRAFLHIGIGKTGTSAIQKTLMINRERLVDSGFLYPESPARPTGRHHKLGAYALSDKVFSDVRKLLKVERDDIDGFRRDFVEELDAELSAAPADKIHTVILSDEGLCAIQTTQEIKRIHELLANRFTEISVIMYMRRQDLHAVSQYSQSVKGGRIHVPMLRHMHFYDYFGYLEQWASVFGRDRVIPRVFERERLPNGDVVQDFMDIVGINTSEGLEFAGDLNESLNARAAVFLAQLNRAIESSNDTNRRKGQHAIVSYLLKSYPGKGIKPGKAEAEAFAKTYEESNERTRATWFSSEPALFTSSFSSYPDVADPTRMSPAEFSQMMIEVLGNLAYEYSALVEKKKK